MWLITRWIPSDSIGKVQMYATLSRSLVHQPIIDGSDSQWRFSRFTNDWAHKGEEEHVKFCLWRIHQVCNRPYSSVLEVTFLPTFVHVFLCYKPVAAVQQNGMAYFIEPTDSCNNNLLQSFWGEQSLFNSKALWFPSSMMNRFTVIFDLSFRKNIAILNVYYKETVGSSYLTEIRFGISDCICKSVSVFSIIFD